MVSNDHATKDLIDLETRLDAHLEAKLTGLRDQLVESMRDAQTGILRGFETYQTSQHIKMRKLAADVSNIDKASALRIDA
ncbi:MAG TPA: hypothetical protein VKU01_36840, partial [Bryobacteraceae bacterium]|nr:hypothetical protein [Bryobacteraceae bacterium]